MFVLFSVQSLSACDLMSVYSCCLLRMLRRSWMTHKRPLTISRLLLFIFLLRFYFKINIFICRAVDVIEIDRIRLCQSSLSAYKKVTLCVIGHLSTCVGDWLSACWWLDGWGWRWRPTGTWTDRKSTFHLHSVICNALLVLWVSWFLCLGLYRICFWEIRPEPDL